MIMMMMVVGNILVETFLLINYFFDATHTSSGIFLREKQTFATNDCFFSPSSIKH